MPPAAATSGQLARILVDSGLVNREQLRQAASQRSENQTLLHALVDMRVADEVELAQAIAKGLGLEYYDFMQQSPDPMAAAIIPEQVARRYTMLPVAVHGDDGLKVAMADPTNILATDDLRSLVGGHIEVAVSTRSDILTAIDNLSQVSVGDLGTEPTAAEEESLSDLEQGATDEDAPLIKFVNSLIARAIRDRASDIHVEPGERLVYVRFRIDGVLHDVTEQSKRIHAALISRLKIMADLDIAEKRVPQDGRIGVRAGGKAIDLRVSSLPTVWGEKIVLRILDKSSGLLELGDLDFSDDNYARYYQTVAKPYGMMLVTGPTGSGKSTTLYATLAQLNKPGVNIVTVEDPVEYRLPRVNQVQINPKAGLTFPLALRSILRQDPDIVLVGEMRDNQTAQIGMEAALTGHLVLSTLHTNDAPSAVTRLTEMGIDPFLVASGVDCVLAQRLARRLCDKCKEPYEPEAAELEAAGLSLGRKKSLTLYKSVGCRTCSNTGYRGRIAVHEVMMVTEEVERLIVTKGSTEDINQMAQSQGMTPLRQDALSKVVAGLTTLEEVGRVVV